MSKNAHMIKLHSRIFLTANMHIAVTKDNNHAGIVVFCYSFIACFYTTITDSPKMFVRLLKEAKNERLSAFKETNLSCREKGKKEVR